MSTVKGTLGQRGLGDVPSRYLAKLLCSPPLAWWFIITVSPEKGFCKEHVNVLCMKIKTTHRDSNFHTRTAHSQLSGSSPCPPQFAVQARKSARF